MMIRKSHAASVILLCVTTAALAAPKKQSAAPRYGVPKLRPGQLWISSVPIGLEVYPGAKTEGKPVGRTPLILDAKSVGPQVTVVLRKEKDGAALPDQTDFIDFTSETNHSMWIRDAGVDTDVGRGLTYRVDPQRQTLIALFQSRSGNLTDWARQYPPGRNFSFGEKAARNDLAKRGVPALYVDLAIDLLHRGGKVALPARDGWIVAQVMPSGSVTVATPPR
jgi:hypothetical protein